MRRPDTRLTSRRPELSQHFLREPAARALVRRLRLPRGTLVVEPGAGDGAITVELAREGYRVIAIEKDPRLFRELVAGTRDQARITCRLGDALRLPLPTSPYAVISNVPYGITAALMRRLLHAAPPPDEALLVLQREAAEKFAGVPHETLFSLLYKPRFEIAIACGLRRSDFVPPPRVSSSVLRLKRRAVPLTRRDDRYRALVAAGFRYGAADVSRALRRQLTPWQVKRLGYDLGFSPHAAASQLTFEQWLAIFRFVEHECLGHDPTRAAVA